MIHSKRIFLAHLATLPLWGCSIPVLKKISTEKIHSPDQVGLFAPRIGQSWQYQQINQYNSEVVDVFNEKISTIQDQQIIISRLGSKKELPSEVQTTRGYVKVDPYWDYLQTYDNPVPIWLDPLNQIRSTQFKMLYHANQSSYVLSMQIFMQQRGWERVHLESGSFDTVKIEKYIYFVHHDSNRLESSRTDIYWFAPTVGRWVVRETNGKYFISSGRRRIDYREDYFRYELRAYTT